MEITCEILDVTYSNQTDANVITSCLKDIIANLDATSQSLQARRKRAEIQAVDRCHHQISPKLGCVKGPPCGQSNVRIVTECRNVGIITSERPGRILSKLCLSRRVVPGTSDRVLVRILDLVLVLAMDRYVTHSQGLIPKPRFQISRSISTLPKLSARPIHGGVAYVWD